jgi:hypothetical protein
MLRNAILVRVSIPISLYINVVFSLFQFIKNIIILNLFLSFDIRRIKPKKLASPIEIKISFLGSPVNHVWSLQDHVAFDSTWRFLYISSGVRITTRQLAKCE